MCFCTIDAAVFGRSLSLSMRRSCTVLRTNARTHATSWLAHAHCRGQDAFRRLVSPVFFSTAADGTVQVPP